MLHVNGNELAERQKAQLFLPSSCQKCLLDLVATFGQVRPAFIMDGNDGGIPERGCKPCSYRCSERNGDGPNRLTLAAPKWSKATATWKRLATSSNPSKSRVSPEM